MTIHSHTTIASAGSAPLAPRDEPVRWPPPPAAAALYVGNVMHARMKPAGHRFTYSVFSLLVDLDRLAEADGLGRLFSVNHGNVVSFHERDHMSGDYPSLRAYVDALLVTAGIDRAERVLLVCYPRIAGYVFNPLSVYYAYGDGDRLVALIYEVRNTFGERHTYVCPVADGEVTEAGIRQELDKRFYVSPFIGMDMRYRFRMLPPGDEIRWRILETDSEGPLLSATFSGRLRPLDDRTLAPLLLRMPFLTVKIVAGIHFEALRLWRKRVKLVPHPAPPALVSIADDDTTVSGGNPRDRS